MNRLTNDQNYLWQMGAYDNDFNTSFEISYYTKEKTFSNLLLLWDLKEIMKCFIEYDDMFY